MTCGSTIIYGNYSCSPSSFVAAFKLRRLPASQSALFNIAGHTDEQLQQFKASTLSSLVFLLSHKEFVFEGKSVL